MAARTRKTARTSAGAPATDLGDQTPIVAALLRAYVTGDGAGMAKVIRDLSVLEARFTLATAIPLFAEVLKGNGADPNDYIDTLSASPQRTFEAPEVSKTQKARLIIRSVISDGEWHALSEIRAVAEANGITMKDIHNGASQLRKMIESDGHKETTRYRLARNGMPE